MALGMLGFLLFVCFIKLAIDLEVAQFEILGRLAAPVVESWANGSFAAWRSRPELQVD